MADELQIDLGLKYKSDRMVEAVTRAIVAYIASASGGHYASGVLSVATSATAIPMGSVATGGFAIFKNLDATNYVTIRAGSGGADVVKLKTGESALFRLATNTPYAIANSAAVNLEYLIVED